MLKSLLNALIIITCISGSALSVELPDNFNYEHLASTPMLEGGRFKPFEAFAGKTIETITGRWSFKRKSPVEYTIAIASSHAWAQEELILIDYKPLKELLGLDKNQKHFSYNAVAARPEFSRQSQIFMEKVRNETELTMMDNKFSNVLHRMNLFSELMNGSLLTIVPPPPGSEPNAAWLPINQPSPYSPAKQEEILGVWRKIISSVQQNSPTSFEQATKDLKTTLAALNPEVTPSEKKMQREIGFYKTRPFLTSWILYLTAFFVLLLSFQFPQKWITWTGYAIFGLGYLYNTYGFILRSIIAGHPSVSNMYESVIFVSWGIITIALIFEIVYHQKWFATSAAILGVCFLVMADLMPFDSNIEPLVPVLRSNYWLIIHVMTITLSYSAFALAVTLAHIVLFFYFINSQRKQIVQTLSKFLYRVLQVGVVLLAAGTILGGVWAAESWGRFWGWDPKETWALISLLGYLAILHARYANWLRNIGTAIFSILGFWLILMTWYGVNFVLGTGLHSYGFGAGGGWYILGFLIFEILVLLVFGIKHYATQQAMKAALQPAE
jgi:cytochrome c-type biogenesis protein CcsB